MGAVLGLFAAGLMQGVASGVAPGPLMALILVEAFRRGSRAAALVAVAPLVTDGPIILLAILVSQRAPMSALHWLSVVGGGYVIWLGVGSVRTSLGAAPTAAPLPGAAPPSTWASFRAGVLTNLLNPHPYLYWSVVGISALGAATKAGGPWAGAALIGGVYAGLVGTNLVVAKAAAGGATLIGGRGHRRVLACCGVALVGLGLLLAVGGLRGLV